MKWTMTIVLGLATMLIAASQLPGSGATNRSASPAHTNFSLRDGLVAAGGTVEPRSEARQLSATVVGRLVQLSFKEGDQIAAGDVIAEIENGELKAQLAAARASVVARESELERLNAGARDQEIREAKAALNEAEAIAQVARTTFDRRRELGTKQVLSAQSVDEARADRDAAAARRALMAERLSLLTAPPRSEDVAIAQANLEMAKARVAEISAQIEKTLIRSPIAGSVLKLHRRLGETVTNLPPTPIVTVGDISRLRVRADLDETDVARVAVGQIAWITADAFGNRRFRGTVSEIGTQLGRKNFRREDPEERIDTRILEVLIDLDDAQLPVGLPVDVIFEAPGKTLGILDSTDPSRNSIDSDG